MTPLFGGAITVDLPSSLLDASNLREIPDNQEVFLFPSNASFVIEILERVEASDDEGAAKFHFDALAHDNDAVSKSIQSITVPSSKLQSPPETPRPTMLTGEQEVRKFNRPSPDHVQILMAIYRVETKWVDIVFTANIPKGEDQSVVNVFDIAAASLRIKDFGLFA